MYWIILCIVLILVLILFTNLNITIEYKRVKEHDHIFIEVSFWFGLIAFKYNIPVLQIASLLHGVKVHHTVTQDEGETAKIRKKHFWITPQKVRKFIKKMLQLRDRVHDMQVIAKKTMKKVKCDKFEWHTRIGVGDAASTGVISGLAWAVKTSLFALFTRYMTVRTKPDLNVVPAFQNKAMDTHFLCILRFRIGYAIIAGIRILFNLRKGREGLWQSTLFRA